MARKSEATAVDTVNTDSAESVIADIVSDSDSIVIDDPHDTVVATDAAPTEVAAPATEVAPKVTRDVVTLREVHAELIGYQCDPDVVTFDWLAAEAAKLVVSDSLSFAQALRSIAEDNAPAKEDGRKKGKGGRVKLTDAEKIQARIDRLRAKLAQVTV